MKHFIFTFFPLLLTLCAFAQKTSNIVVFAEDPKPFFLIVNGIKQNPEPETNVKVTGLTSPSLSLKVVFPDGTPDINKKAYFESMGKEMTFRIVHTKKGYKLRYFGEVDLASATSNDNQSIIVYQTVPPAPAPVTQTTVITEETTTTTNGSAVTPVGTSVTNGENVNVNMNVGGFGVNVNVNESNTDINQNVDVISSSSSTTTTTTTTTNGGTLLTTGNLPVSAPPSQPEIVYVNGYNGPVGCAMPMQDISQLKSAIEQEDFSDSKLNVAKQALKNKCVTVSQVRELMKLFDFEDKKLEFAKYAYNYTYDIGNYYLINQDFDFSSTKKKLNNFLESK